MSELEIIGLNQKYRGGAKALTDFYLSSCGIAAVVGGEKAGKTTLLKCLAGLEDYDGEVRLNGKLLKDVSPKDRNIFMLFDDLAIFGRKTVKYNLAYPLSVRKVAESEIDEKVAELAERFNLTALLDVKAKKADKSALRRLSYARMFVRKSDLYLIDNPLKGLDDEERGREFETLAAYIRELEGVVIYATDKLKEAAALTDNITLLNLGYTKQAGSFEDFYERPQSLFAAKAAGELMTRTSTLLADEQGLFLMADDDTVRLPKEYLKRLLSGDYIGKEIIVAKRPDNDKYFLFDLYAEASILKE